MGFSTISIPFFVDTITIQPHTVGLKPMWLARQYLEREVSIQEFADGSPCSLEQVQETGEYIVRLPNGDFMQGSEV